MNEASCGSCLTTASASLRMRAQIGSTLSIGVILCGWAIAVLRRRGFSLFEFSRDREPSVGAPPPDGTPTLPSPASGGRVNRNTLLAGEGRVGASRPLLKEPQHRLLVNTVSDRQHMIAARNIERTRPGHQCGKLIRGARQVVLGADREQPGDL